jgi:tetratricopeptide (TPR) repeat protein
LGVIQEQHAERCRLFAQWKNLEWPILHDPINRLRLNGVPIVVDIDERGIVRGVNPDVQSWVNALPSEVRQPNSALPPDQHPDSRRPNIGQLREASQASPSVSAWRELGDALILWQDRKLISEAIGAYESARELQPDDPAILFRLGVAHRIRYDSPGVTANPEVALRSTNRVTNDFQQAVAYWQAALDLDPNQYIYRRRIQQYGPRLIKPYPFYDWVSEARGDIQARGETPLELAVEPGGAEFAAPSQTFGGQELEQQSPDPQGAIRRDEAGLITSRVTVVPARIQPGESVRVHVEFQPVAAARWNNESDPLVLWIELPSGWKAERQRLESSLPNVAESAEVRSFEVEIQTRVEQSLPAEVRAYALYYVCEKTHGTCLFLRQDLVIPIGNAAAE